MTKDKKQLIEQLAAQIEKACEEWNQTSDYKILNVYLTESDVWQHKFMIVGHLDYKRRILPFEDFSKLHSIFKKQLGSLFEHTDSFIMNGGEEPYHFKYNDIVDPSTGQTFTVFYHYPSTVQPTTVLK